MGGQRLTAEREKLIRELHSSMTPDDCDICLLLNELQAVRAERDEAQRNEQIAWEELREADSYIAGMDGK